MKNSMICCIAKGMLVGAIAGGSMAYIAGMDVMCKCRMVRRKAKGAYKNLRKVMTR